MSFTPASPSNDSNPHSIWLLLDEDFASILVPCLTVAPVTSEHRQPSNTLIEKVPPVAFFSSSTGLDTCPKQPAVKAVPSPKLSGLVRFRPPIRKPQPWHKAMAAFHLVSNVSTDKQPPQCLGRSLQENI